ncbi:MAG: hypothetical protein ABIY48_10710, partial [Acidimicrobiales bacterium]
AGLSLKRVFEGHGLASATLGGRRLVSRRAVLTRTSVGTHPPPMGDAPHPPALGDIPPPPS